MKSAEAITGEIYGDKQYASLRKETFIKLLKDFQVDALEAAMLEAMRGGSDFIDESMPILRNTNGEIPEENKTILVAMMATVDKCIAKICALKPEVK